MVGYSCGRVGGLMRRKITVVSFIRVGYGFILGDELASRAVGLKRGWAVRWHNFRMVNDLLIRRDTPLANHLQIAEHSCSRAYPSLPNEIEGGYSSAGVSKGSCSELV